MLDKKNVDMLTAHGVFTEAELRSRYEIQLENYCKNVRIEALTMVDMARKEIIPAVESYAASLAPSVAARKAPYRNWTAIMKCGVSENSRR